MEFIQISTTVESEPRARRVANLLLEKRLSSCVQVIGPIQSHYWWNGVVQHATEWLCLIKARKSDYRQIEMAIKKIHPYTLPEIVMFPILAGSKDYLQWMRSETPRRARSIDSRRARA